MHLKQKSDLPRKTYFSRKYNLHLALSIPSPRCIKRSCFTHEIAITSRMKTQCKCLLISVIWSNPHGIFPSSYKSQLLCTFLLSQHVFLSPAISSQLSLLTPIFNLSGNPTGQSIMSGETLPSLCAYWWTLWHLMSNDLLLNCFHFQSMFQRDYWCTAVHCSGQPRYMEIELINSQHNTLNNWLEGKNPPKWQILLVTSYHQGLANTAKSAIPMPKHADIFVASSHIMSFEPTTWPVNAFDVVA